MGRKHEPWKRIKIRVSGPQAGDFLAEFFGDEKYRTYNGLIWEYTLYLGDNSIADLDKFKTASLNYDTAVEFQSL